jgi:TP901 family phage tail tape measure protein
MATGFVIAVKSAAEFEKRISAIGAVSGATEKQLELIRQKALQLGADTVFSASEAAGAMEALSKAGVSTGDILNGAADAAVNLAAAGEIDLASAAEIAANAMNNFNLKGEDLGHVADLISGAANASSIGVADFGLSLQQAGAIASTVGIGFDDLATAIALMGKAGIKGSDAGTSLKTMLLNLNPSTAKQVELMKELGIVTADGSNQFFDAQGNAKGLADISGVLNTSLSGMTRQQQLATLEILFGSDAIRAASVLTKQGSKGFHNMAGAMGEVGAEETAEKRLDNLAGALEQLKGSVETAFITAGQGMQGTVRTIAESFTGVLNGILGVLPALNPMIEIIGLLFEAIAPVIKPAIEAISQFVAAIGTALIPIIEDLTPLFPALIPLVGALAEIAVELLDAFAPLIPIMVDLTKILVAGLVPVLEVLEPILPAILISFLALKAIGSLVGIFKAVKAAFILLKAAMLANPFVAIAAAVIAIAFLIYQNWDAIKAFLINVWNAIKDAAIAAWTALKDGVLQVVGDLLGWLTDGFASWLDFWFGIAEGILAGAAAAFGWLPGVGDDIKAARDGFRDFRDGVIGDLRAQAQEFHSWGDQAVGETSRATGSARSYAGMLKSIPKRVATDVSVSTAAATAEFRGWLASMQGASISVAAKLYRTDEGLAKGTRYWPGGVALVGEEGPELAYLARGAVVKTARETARILSMLGSVPKAHEGAVVLKDTLLQVAAGEVITPIESVRGRHALGSDSKGSLKGVKIVGSLTMDKSGKAFIRGVVVEEMNDEKKFQEGVSRMAR